MVRSSWGIAGLKRLKKNGEKQVEVVVRHDLSDSDFAMEELITDNLYRQQLDPVSIARCYEELRVLEIRRCPQKKQNTKMGDFRDQIAARMPVKITGRHLDRLRRLLKLPLAVQDAIRDGVLKTTHGDLILAKPKKDQEQIAEAILAGMDAKQLIQRFGLQQLVHKKPPEVILQDVLKSLNKGVPTLEAEIDKLEKIQTRNDHKALVIIDRSLQLFSKVRDRLQEQVAKREINLKAMRSEFKNVSFRSPEGLTQ